MASCAEMSNKKKWRSLRKCFPRWDGAECFSNVNTLKIKGLGAGGRGWRNYKLSPEDISRSFQYYWFWFDLFSHGHCKKNDWSLPRFSQKNSPFCVQCNQFTQILCQFTKDTRTQNTVQCPCINLWVCDLVSVWNLNVGFQLAGILLASLNEIKIFFAFAICQRISYFVNDKFVNLSIFYGIMSTCEIDQGHRWCVNSRCLTFATGHCQ